MSSRYICTSADAMNDLLIDPARKCVSAVTGVLLIAIGEPDAAGPLDARHPHERDAGAGHAGIAQDRLHGVSELLDGLRKWILVGRLRADGHGDARNQCGRDDGSHASKV